VRKTRFPRRVAQPVELAPPGGSVPPPVGFTQPSGPVREPEVLAPRAPTRCTQAESDEHAALAVRVTNTPIPVLRDAFEARPDKTELEECMTVLGTMSIADTIRDARPMGLAGITAGVREAGEAWAAHLVGITNFGPGQVAALSELLPECALDIARCSYASRYLTYILAYARVEVGRSCRARLAKGLSDAVFPTAVSCALFLEWAALGTPCEWEAWFAAQAPGAASPTPVVEHLDSLPGITNESLLGGTPVEPVTFEPYVLPPAVVACLEDPSTPELPVSVPTILEVTALDTFDVGEVHAQLATQGESRSRALLRVLAACEALRPVEVSIALLDLESLWIRAEAPEGVGDDPWAHALGLTRSRKSSVSRRVRLQGPKAKPPVDAVLVPFLTTNVWWGEGGRHVMLQLPQRDRSCMRTQSVSLDGCAVGTVGHHLFLGGLHSICMAGGSWLLNLAPFLDTPLLVWDPASAAAGAPPYTDKEGTVRQLKRFGLGAQLRTIAARAAEVEQLEPGWPFDVPQARALAKAQAEAADMRRAGRKLRTLLLRVWERHKRRRLDARARFEAIVYEGVWSITPEDMRAFYRRALQAAGIPNPDFGSCSRIFKILEYAKTTFPEARRGRVVFGAARSAKKTWAEYELEFASIGSTGREGAFFPEWADVFTHLRDDVRFSDIRRAQTIQASLTAWNRESLAALVHFPPPLSASKAVAFFRLATCLGTGDLDKLHEDVVRASKADLEQRIERLVQGARRAEQSTPETLISWGLAGLPAAPKGAFGKPGKPLSLRPGLELASAVKRVCGDAREWLAQGLSVGVEAQASPEDGALLAGVKVHYPAFPPEMELFIRREHFAAWPVAEPSALGDFLPRVWNWLAKSQFTLSRKGNLVSLGHLAGRKPLCETPVSTHGDDSAGALQLQAPRQIQSEVMGPTDSLDRRWDFRMQVAFLAELAKARELSWEVLDRLRSEVACPASFVPMIQAGVRERFLVCGLRGIAMSLGISGSNWFTMDHLPSVSTFGTGYGGVRLCQNLIRALESKAVLRVPDPGKRPPERFWLPEEAAFKVGTLLPRVNAAHTTKAGWGADSDEIGITVPGFKQKRFCDVPFSQAKDFVWAYTLALQGRLLEVDPKVDIRDHLRWPPPLLPPLGVLL
jgi:hypothetical protein